MQCSMTSKVVVCAGLLAAVGCHSERNTEVGRGREETAEAVRAARREAEIARDRISKRLDQLDIEIDKIQQKAEKASGKTNAKLKRQSQELRADARRLRDRMSCP